MKDQPEALRLADALDDEFTQGRISNHTGRKSAAELRRLSAENERLTIERDEARRTAREAHEIGTRVVAQRDALLEALKDVVAFTGAHGGPYAQARAAIKAAEGENT